MARTKTKTNTKPTINANPAKPVFDKMGFDSIEEGIKIFVDPDTPLKQAVDVLKTLMSYQYSKMPAAIVQEQNLNRLDEERARELRNKLLNEYDPTK